MEPARWQDLWRLLGDYGIRHSPAGFESVAVPLEARDGFVRSGDGRLQPALIVGFAVPLPQPQGKDGPPLTVEDVLDGAAALQRPGAFDAFLADVRRKVVG